MSELVWSRIGAQCDATIGIDRAGTGMFNRGRQRLSDGHASVRVGVLCDGISLTDQQVLPEAWIADTPQRRTRLASGVRRQPRSHPPRRDVP